MTTIEIAKITAIAKMMMTKMTMIAIVKITATTNRTTIPMIPTDTMTNAATALTTIAIAKITAIANMTMTKMTTIVIAKITVIANMTMILTIPTDMTTKAATAPLFSNLIRMRIVIMWTAMKTTTYTSITCYQTVTGTVMIRNAAAAMINSKTREDLCSLPQGGLVPKWQISHHHCHLEE